MTARCSTRCNAIFWVNDTIQRTGRVWIALISRTAISGLSKVWSGCSPSLADLLRGCVPPPTAWNMAWVISNCITSCLGCSIAVCLVSLSGEAWPHGEHDSILHYHGAKIGASKLCFTLCSGFQSRFCYHFMTFSKHICSHLGFRDEGLKGGLYPPRVKLCRRPSGASPSNGTLLGPQKQEQQHHLQRMVYLTAFILL